MKVKYIWFLPLGFLFLVSTQSIQPQSFNEEILNDLYEEGQQWVEDYVPEEVLEEVEFPSKEEWVLFWRQLEEALHSEDIQDLAWMYPHVELALKYLSLFEGNEPYVDWLKQRLDYFKMSQAVVKAVPSPKAGLSPRNIPSVKRITASSKPPVTLSSKEVKQKRDRMARRPDHWKNQLRGRPLPKDSRELIPILKKIFVSEGISPQWVWLAEVESSLNPQAKSPVGAVGLFQLMPAAANRFGLRIKPVDERLDPERNARAAAKYLKVLYRKFKCWPLALAAYNAGEGSVGRLLKKHQASTFDAIADHLPLETQMYVPKVLTLVSLREKIDAEKLPPPSIP